jgi:hypothetical protein
LLLAHSVFAQNPELVDELIETPVMSVGLAARFLYQVDNPGSVALASTSNEEATIWATERGLIRSSVAAQDVASYAVVSRMMVEYIGFSTSTMYWLTGLPRYALRELSFRQLVSPTVSEDHTMSGEQFMMLLARSFDWRERFRPGAHKDET